MAESQRHGFEFEFEISRSNIFPGWIPTNKNYTESMVDIPAKYDSVLQIDTQIKTLHIGADIAMGDARAFFLREKPLRLLLAEYFQESPTHKKIKAIKEVIFTEEHFKELKGSVLFTDVENFHNSLLAFKEEGSHFRARIFHKEYRKKLIEDGHISIIKLAPKVDSKGQRRVQCAIPNKKYIVDKFGPFIETEYRGINFDISIESTRRKRNEK